MPGVTLVGTGQALDVVPTVIHAFDMLYDALGVCKKCADHKPMAPHTGATYHHRNYGRLVANDLEYGLDIGEIQTLADEDTTAEASEAGLRVVMPRLTLRRDADPDLLRRTGRLMANGLALKEDRDGTAMFTSWTPIVGAAGDVSSVGLFMAGVSRMGIGNNRTNPEPFPGPYHSIMHPLHWGRIAATLMPIAQSVASSTAPAIAVYGDTLAGGAPAGSMGQQILERGPTAVHNFMGFNIWMDPNMVVDSSDDASSVLFAKEGFKWIPEEGPMLETDKDAKLRGTEMVLSSSYAWMVYRAGASGVEYLADASLPTG